LKLGMNRLRGLEVPKFYAATHRSCPEGAEKRRIIHIAAGPGTDTAQ
jgi:hypothetical protein